MMNRVLLCKKVSERITGLSDPAWDTSQIHYIDQYPWKNAQRPYSPTVQVRLLHNGQSLFVRFDCWEEDIRATYTEPNDPVCRDSCVEFFFQPDRSDERYLSFEINPLGAMLIGLGRGGNDITYLKDDRSQFCIDTLLTPCFWQVCYEIPQSFLGKYFGSLSAEIRGNFMKCADRSSRPHHGCWNLIGTDIPMFHVPQYFGKIVLEDLKNP